VCASHREMPFVAFLAFGCELAAGSWVLACFAYSHAPSRNRKNAPGGQQATLHEGFEVL